MLPGTRVDLGRCPATNLVLRDEFFRVRIHLSALLVRLQVMFALLPKSTVSSPDLDRTVPRLYLGTPTALTDCDGYDYKTKLVFLQNAQRSQDSL
jgi:hypothetical protein